MALGAGLSGIARALQDERVNQAAAIRVQDGSAQLVIGRGKFGNPEAFGIAYTAKERVGFVASCGQFADSFDVSLHCHASLVGTEHVERDDIRGVDFHVGARADSHAAILGIVEGNPNELVVALVLKLRLDENLLAFGDSHSMSPVDASYIRNACSVVNTESAFYGN
jgi:hypothetical protein